MKLYNQINTNNCNLSTVLTGDGSKTAEIIQNVILPPSHRLDFPDCLLLLLSISVFLLFSFSVFTLFSCRFRAVD